MVTKNHYMNRFVRYAGYVLFALVTKSVSCHLYLCGLFLNCFVGLYLRIMAREKPLYHHEQSKLGKGLNIGHFCSLTLWDCNSEQRKFKTNRTIFSNTSIL